MEIERSPYVLPPAPKDYTLSAGTVVGVPTPPRRAEWLEGRVKHFSSSSLRMLKICPEQYRQRYILGRKERPGGHLTLGTAMHGAVGHNLTQKIESHEDLPVAEVLEFFHDYSWPEAVAKDGGEDQISWDEGMKPDDYRRDGERMAIAYHKTVMPVVQPVEPVEQRFDLWVPGIPVPFVGYIDWVEGTHVADLKTGKQVSRKPDANWRTQGQIYTLVKEKPVHFHSVSRAKTPSIATPLTDPAMSLPYRDDVAETTRTLLRFYVDQVEWLMAKYGPDESWPTTGVFMDLKGGRACDYCGFRKWCPAWAWERAVPA